ncbi:MAG: hypothetical protein ACRC5A_12870, partial [Enterobacteriaceae bacterium]
MQFFDLFIILLPLAIGYLLPVSHSGALRLVNQLLSWLIFF